MLTNMLQNIKLGKKWKTNLQWAILWQKFIILLSDPAHFIFKWSIFLFQYFSALSQLLTFSLQKYTVASSTGGDKSVSQDEQTKYLLAQPRSASRIPVWLLSFLPFQFTFILDNGVVKIFSFSICQTKISDFYPRNYWYWSASSIVLKLTYGL